MFKELKMDRLIAMRCAPNQSYTNIVERVMSLLNICYQNIALERDTTEFEDVIKKCVTLEQLRAKDDMRKVWVESLKNIFSLLETRTERMVLKDVPFKTFKVSDSDLIEFRSAATNLDQALPTKIESKKMQASDLVSCVDYHNFLCSHCHEGEYVFQIRRCLDLDCCPGQPLSKLPDWLPSPIPDESNPGHYKKFSEVVGNIPNDSEVPSIKFGPPKFDEKEQGCLAQVLCAQNVRKTVGCSSCKRMRCIYGKRKLLTREIHELNHVMKEYDYICGSHLIPDSSFLKGELFTRVAMTCQSPMEWQFYSSNALHRKDRCYYCGSIGASTDNVLTTQFKTVLPLCIRCQNEGKKPMTRGPKDTGRRRKMSSSSTASKKKKV